MRGRVLVIAALVFAGACASPREKVLKAALNDYQRTNHAAVAFARAQVKQLVAATLSFRSSLGRWPQTFNELVEFAMPNRLALDPLAFNDVTFAALPDGTVQLHYDVSCARFDTPQYKFTQSGSVNVKTK